MGLGRAFLWLVCLLCVLMFSLLYGCWYMYRSLLHAYRASLGDAVGVRLSSPYLYCACCFLQPPGCRASDLFLRSVCAVLCPSSCFFCAVCAVLFSSPI